MRRFGIDLGLAVTIAIGAILAVVVLGVFRGRRGAGG